MDKLFALNNAKLDHALYCALIPFWNAKFTYEADAKFDVYDELPHNAKKVFRALVYEQYHRIENNKPDSMSKNLTNNVLENNKPDILPDSALENHPLSTDEFTLLYNFLDFINYNKKEFLPYMRRYLYKHRGNYEFMKSTARIHRNSSYLRINSSITWREFYCIVLGLEPNSPLAEIKKIADRGEPDAIDAYTFITHRACGCGGRFEASFKRWEQNWEENKHSGSLHNLACCYKEGEGCTADLNKAFKLFKLNWEENKHSGSLFELACCYNNGNGCPMDLNAAFKLHKLNWEENKNSDSLHNLACCYKEGEGCTADLNEAFKLFKLNWEENKDSDSLLILAICYYNGNGCTADLNEAFRLFKLNWEENKDSDSLHNLAICYDLGRGCFIDSNEAFRLFKLNWEENEDYESLRELANLYYNGRGCDKNIDEYNKLIYIYKSRDK